VLVNVIVLVGTPEVQGIVVLVVVVLGVVVLVVDVGVTSGRAVDPEVGVPELDDDPPID